MSTNLSKETAAHVERWSRWMRKQDDFLPQDWAVFADYLERQRNDARQCAEKNIQTASVMAGEITCYKETIKALEETLSHKNMELDHKTAKIAKLESALAESREISNKNAKMALDHQAESFKARAKLAQVENQLAAKDGYWSDDMGGKDAPQTQPVDDGGPASKAALRDLLAAHAPEMPDQWWRDSAGQHIAFADAAWRYFHADAMLAARNGKEGA